MLTIGSTLSIFLMLGLSSLAVFWAKRLHIPHTVLLVLIGIGLGLLANFHLFNFVSSFSLTPELLFYLLLPTLIFESAYNMNSRKLVHDSTPILLLAIVGFLISTLLVAGFLFFGLELIGVQIPLLLALMFGALISATDPVAVLALFKEYGVPPRLSLIFEGESLFNDATAVALFLILLDIGTSGILSTSVGLSGLLMFVEMLLGGIIFGLLIGGLFSSLVGIARDSEVASITLTIVLAHITFITAELISAETVLAISPIISTTVASLLMGNYGRAKIHPKAEEVVNSLWEQLAFMANSLIFILIGALIIQTPFNEPVVLFAALLAVPAVALARALSIYPVVGIYNLSTTAERRIPSSWQHLLSWGSLRGALAITMVLLIPDDFILSGWSLESSPKEFLLAITISCITATLFIKATTIKLLIDKFKLDKLTEVESVEYQEARALMHHKVTKQLQRYQERGYIDADIAERLLSEHESAFTSAYTEITNLPDSCRNDLCFRVLRIFAIGIEKRHLEDLYDHQEINEIAYRRIYGKLQLQLEAIEDGDLSPDTTLHVDARDVFERLASVVRYVIPRTEEQLFKDKYMYYRAQTILSRKVLKQMDIFKETGEKIFPPAAIEHVYGLYTKFKKSAANKLVEHAETNPALAKALAETLAEHSVHTIEEQVIAEVYKKELITPKLYITLREEVRNGPS